MPSTPRRIFQGASRPRPRSTERIWPPTSPTVRIWPRARPEPNSISAAPRPISTRRWRSSRSCRAALGTAAGALSPQPCIVVTGSKKRLLAFSDIHNNLVAVRKLRALEKNTFDAIIVAGDIGNASAADCFRILATFKCPVVYVYGNWDHELSHKRCFEPGCHLLQSNIVTIGKINFTGFSGCPTNWGKNPIARKIHRRIEIENRAVVDALKHRTTPAGKIRHTKAYQSYELQLQSAENEVLKLNRESIGKALSKAGIDPRKCVVVTHERLARLSEEIPGVLLHLFGHLHKFSERTFKATKYVNVAAL